jgi:hypothetical protein
MKRVAVQTIPIHKTYGISRVQEISGIYDVVLSLSFGALGVGLNIPSEPQTTPSNVVGGVVVSRDEPKVSGNAWLDW